MLFRKTVKKYSYTDSGSLVSEDFTEIYPIIHVDLSKHGESFKFGTVDLEIRWQLASNFGNLANDDDSAYHVYCVVLSDRYITLDG